jgi:hypothetical protein
MKQIFTLLVLAVLNTFSLNAQISEAFENYSSTSNLTNNCWSFLDVDLSTTTGITGSKSLKMISINGDKYTQVLTPYINIVANTSMTFNVSLSVNLAGQAWRTVTVRLLALDGTYSSVLTTLNLDRTSGGGSVHAVTVPFTTAGVFRVSIETNASTENNTFILLDDMVYASTYNYTPGYACGSYPSNVVVPIKLISFNGSLVNNKANLQWSVADNETGAYFEVQKSNDGKLFNTAAVIFVSSKNGVDNYSFTDPKDLGNGAYYKIKILNNNGSTSQSRIVFLKSQTTNATNRLVVLQNPVASTLMFTYTSAASGKATVNIYNVAGANMLTTVAYVPTGTNTVSLNLDGRFTSGTYLLEVINGAERSVSKLIKK